jgi:cysteine desulfurase
MRPEAREALLRALESPANPSSVHAAGRAARDVVERARAEVGALVGTPAGSVTFVSGGTEANALAIESAKVAGVHRIIMSAIEHDAVTETAKALGPAGRDPAGRRQRRRRPSVAGRGARSAGQGPGLPDAGQQRDGRHPAGGRSLGVGPRRMTACCMSTPSRRPARSPSTSRPSAPTPWRCRPTSWAARRASARWSPGPARPSPVASTAAVRSAAVGPAPRTSRASPASARPPASAQESLASMAEQSHWRDALAERLKAQGAVVLGEARIGCRKPCVSRARASAPRSRS